MSKSSADNGRVSLDRISKLALDRDNTLFLIAESQQALARMREDRRGPTEKVISEYCERLYANTDALAKTRPSTLEGLLVLASVLRDVGRDGSNRKNGDDTINAPLERQVAPLAHALCESLLALCTRRFDAEAYVKRCEAAGYVFELYPKRSGRGWQYADQPPFGGRWSLQHHDQLRAPFAGALRGPNRAAVLKYLLERARKTRTLPALKFQPDKIVKALEAEGWKFQLAPNRDLSGFTYGMFTPDRPRSRPMLFEFSQINRAKNYRPLLRYLIAREGKERVSALRREMRRLKAEQNEELRSAPVLKAA